MDASQWPQGMGLVKPMEEFAASSNITTTTNSSIATRAQGVERRPRPNKEQALNCPRCNSTNTKFCYYNNYSLTQPRYFCKTCRRYWTEGGSLRNVPVGGGSRKNKRSSSSIISSSSAAAATSSSTATAAVATTASTSKELHLDDGHFIPPYKIPKFQYEGQDLNLAFPQQGIPDQYSSYPNNAAVGAFSSMGLLNRPFMPLPEYATGFGMLQELRPPTLNFPVGHGIVGGGEGGSGSGNTGKMLFPMEELKPVVPTGNETAEHFEQSKGQGGGDPPGYWNGISW